MKDTEELTLVGGKVVANSVADVKVTHITATEIKDNRTVDGGYASFGVNFTPTAISRVNFGGGRDDQEHYEAIVHSSLIGAKVFADVEGTLNTKTDKLVEVITDKKVQATKFLFAYSKDIKNQLTDKVKDAKGKVDKIRGKNKVDLEKESSKEDKSVVSLTSYKPLDENKPEATSTNSEPSSSENSKPASDK